MSENNLTSEFRFRELVSGYSSRVDSMDCSSILIVLAAASMITGFATKVSITNYTNNMFIMYPKGLHHSPRKDKNIMKK